MIEFIDIGWSDWAKFISSTFWFFSTFYAIQLPVNRGFGAEIAIIGMIMIITFYQGIELIDKLRTCSDTPTEGEK